MIDQGPDSQPDVVNYRALDEDAVRDVARLLMRHPMHRLKEPLRTLGLPMRGSKGEVTHELTRHLLAQKSAVPVAIYFLDEIEGWGEQHAYLYQARELARSWRDEKQFNGAMKQAGLEGLINRFSPKLLPQIPTISRVKRTDDLVQIRWIEKRQYSERVEAYDDRRDDIIRKAYRVSVERGIATFDLDLVTGSAALLIQRMKNSDVYEDERLKYERELGRIFDFDPVRRIQVGKAIPKIKTAERARERQLALKSISGGTVTFTSKDRASDLFPTDPDLRRSREGLGANAIAKMGNFYWGPVPNTPLDREVHVKIYAVDHRVGIFGEFSEAQVKYVLGRIRTHC